MKFDKKEAAGQPLPFSAPKNPQWVMLAALLLSYAAGYEYVDRCLGFGVASEYSAWRAGVLVFVALYTVVVELAAWAGDRKPSRTAAAWWCYWLVQSLAMAGWSLHTDDLGFWQVVAWHCTAIYYVLAIFIIIGGNMNKSEEEQRMEDEEQLQYLKKYNEKKFNKRHKNKK